MFGIAGTAELSTFCPGTGTWNRLQDGNAMLTTDGTMCMVAAQAVKGRLVLLRYLTEY